MKDALITRPVSGIILAIIKEANAEGVEEWNAYLINNKDVDIEGVLVSTNGYGQRDKQQVNTSMLRHFLDEVPSKSFKKIEPMMEDVFGLFNQFWVSFFEDKLMYDKKYIFPAESISEKNFTKIPIIGKMGVMIE